MFRKEIGERIIAARKGQHTTQRELSHRTGIAQAVLSKLEAGLMKPNTEYLHLIATALGLSIADLTPGRAGSKQSGPELKLVESQKPIAEQLFSLDAEMPKDQWPVGLEGFLERYGERERISRRERWYLTRMRYHAGPFLEIDDDFWLDNLSFWRNYLRRQDSPRPGPEGGTSG